MAQARQGAGPVAVDVVERNAPPPRRSDAVAGHAQQDCTSVSATATGPIDAQLDRIQAQLAYLAATMQRVLALLERIAGREPPPDATSR